jgi:hypothetical protein
MQTNAVHFNFIYKKDNISDLSMIRGQQLKYVRILIIAALIYDE